MLFIFFIFWKQYSHRESNSDQRFRKPTFYPFNYGSNVWKLSELESVAKIRILSDSAKYSYSFMYRMSRHAHLKKKIDSEK